MFILFHTHAVRRPFQEFSATRAFGPLFLVWSRVLIAVCKRSDVYFILSRWDPFILKIFAGQALAHGHFIGPWPWYVPSSGFYVRQGRSRRVSGYQKRSRTPFKPALDTRLTRVRGAISTRELLYTLPYLLIFPCSYN